MNSHYSQHRTRGFTIDGLYRDVVLDAAMLLIDFIEIFRFLVAIMTSNKKKEYCWLESLAAETSNSSLLKVLRSSVSFRVPALYI
ncbi:unnamed protein product [Notodromas monacha]|uniref:Uncharacterized protein n=1 Tax=Notodromas monacha TaxID=399045 RepID=A0A7R9C2G2_9CRUS|nr:unnamed protein product [Notodromas monacha]CAG0925217.1 unnamed protein product [Notodromas monacha]